MKEITIITDGSCRGNPGPGGWAALLRYGNYKRQIQGGARATTNNQMEMTALIEGLKIVKEPCKIKVVTDSKYLINAFTEGWLKNWQRNGWKTSAGKPVKNDELWKELLELTKPHTITWEWVKGHAGHPDNEAVDAAAQIEASKQ